MLIKFPSTKLETLRSVPWMHWGTVVLGAAALVLCLVLMFLVWGAYDASLARQWPTTQGKVLETGIRGKRLTNSKHPDHYWAIVVYEYEVNGTTYRADKVEFDDRSRDKIEVDNQVAKYLVGTEVSAHYDPDNPSHAYLEIWEGEFLPDAVKAAGAALAAILAVFLYNFLWRRHARQVIDLAHGPTGTARLLQALPEDRNEERAASVEGYRQAGTRAPSKEEVERAFEASIGQLIPAAKAGAWGFVGGLLLGFVWALFAVAANPRTEVLAGGSAAAALVGGATLLAGAALTARPVIRRLSGRGRVTFEATWGQVAFALIPVMGFVMALEHISRLRRGELQIGAHDVNPERYGPERGPNLVFFITLAMLWPMIGIVVAVEYLTSG